MVFSRLMALTVFGFAGVVGCAEEPLDEASATSAGLDVSEEAALEGQLRALPTARERMRARYEFADRMIDHRAPERDLAASGRQAAARRYVTDDSVPEADIHEILEGIAAATRAHRASPQERAAEEEYQENLQRFRNSQQAEETE